MMMVNKREQRLIGVALLVGVGLIVYFYGVEPLQEWRRSGSEMIPSREAQLERRAKWQRAAGAPVEELTGAEARRVEPMLSPETVYAIHMPTNRRADNRSAARE